MEPSAKYALGAEVDASGREVDAPTAMSSFVYRFSRLWRSYSLVRSRVNPLLEESSGEPRRSRAADRGRNRAATAAASGPISAPAAAPSRSRSAIIAGPDVELIAVDRDRAQPCRPCAPPWSGTFPARGSVSSRPISPGISRAAPRRHRGRQCHPLRSCGIRWRCCGGGRDYLKPEGRLIVVEYDTDSGNRWVPYPLSYAAFREIGTSRRLHRASAAWGRGHRGGWDGSTAR